MAILASFACAAQVRLDGRAFTLPDGFTIEQVAGPPLVNRPIIADFDELGRLYVDDSSGSGEPVQKQLAEKPHRVVRLESSRGDGKFDRQTVFAEHMMFPEGAMWYAGSLYVGAPPSIWKLTDTTGSGVADQRIEWFKGKTLTGCANDIHGPYLGPDGWIYWCKGAFAEQTYERPGKRPFVTRAAHIFRCRPDGSGIEPVMTGGMDNPAHVVFTAGGERLFTTTFLEHPAGGLRDGIIHAIYGGIYGKVHDVIDDHPHTFPEVMPVLVHLGPAAACGLLRYESGSFGPEYRDNLFATCFNLHKVTRHVLTPQGATFSATNQDFLVCDSLDFHPTDVIEDADGSLLVIDTGGWYKLCCPTSQLGKPDVLGAIYRVRRIGAPLVADARGLKIAWAELSPKDICKLLADPRPAVQKRAIQALADRGPMSLDAIEQVLRSSRSSRARINAVWAATRIDSSQARAAVRIALNDADETVRQAAAHSASVWRDHQAFEKLLDLLAGPSMANRRVAAEALGRLGDAGAVPHLLSALQQPLDHVLEHSLTYALIEIADPKATAAGLASSNPHVRRSAMMALDQMEGGGIDAQVVTAAMSSPDAQLRDSATWIATHHPAWGPAIASALRQRLRSSAVASSNPDVLQSQLASLTKFPEVKDLLTQRLSDPKATGSQRRLVLAAMSNSPLHELPPSWASALSQILDQHDAATLDGAITVLSKLSAGKAVDPQLAQQLIALASRTDLPPELRLDALAAAGKNLPQPDDQTFAFLVSQLAPTQPAANQLRAAQIVARARLAPQQLLTLTDAIKTAGPLEIEPLLSAFSQSNDPALGRKLLDTLRAAKAVASVRPDVLKSRLAHFGPEIQSSAASLADRLSPDRAQQAHRLDELLSTLPSGDIRRGQLLFNGAKAACSTCHAIGYVGGNVGPDLTRVGAIRSRRDLLESIAFPSSSFVQSFEPMMLITRGGDRYYGIVRRNDASEVMLITGPNQEVHVARKDVQEIRPGTVSLMPAGFDQQLSNQELADIVAFLQACR